MMRSMYTGLSGLNVHLTKMDVISNNISNVNTVAYKSGRVTFRDYLSQAMRGATAANETATRGGTNPMQVGLGAKLSSIDNMMSQGAAQLTDRPLDVMINGDGFFIVGRVEAEYLTRAGDFDIDAAGYLNRDGWKVFGWDSEFNEVTKEWEIDKTPVIYPINFSGDKEIMEATPTTESGFEGNLNAETLEDTEVPLSFFDSQGNTYTATVVFQYDKENGVWSYDIKPDSSGMRVAYQNGDARKPVQLGFAATPDIDSEYTPLGFLGFDTNGKPHAVEFSTDTTANQDANNADSNTEFINNLLKAPANAPEGSIQAELFVNKLETSVLDEDITFGNGGTGSIVLDFTDLTQFAGMSTAKALPKDGHEEGKLKDISIGRDGIITGLYTNDKIRPLWQIAISDVPNPEGLEKVGDSLFAVTANSGGRDSELWNCKVGDLRSGTLEMSNANLSEEFTQMITTQRGLQANSKVIVVSDEMIQTARDLKR